jgi:short-subunit dehydrogenase
MPQSIMPHGAASGGLEGAANVGQSDSSRPALLVASVVPEGPEEARGLSMTFANQVAVITGASSGIGWALAKVLAAQGCKVGLVARRRDNLEALAGEVEREGGKAAFAPADVADRAAVGDAIREVAGKLGPVDLLIANAGVGAPTLLSPMNVGDVEKMFRVNVLGVVYAIEAVLPQMLQRRKGHLAAVSSMAAYKGLPGESAYSSSKAAVNTYMEGLRIQLRDRGIAVTTICPGFVKTPMTDVNNFHMPWLLQADDAARRIVRALARRKKVFNFPWQMSVLMRITRWLPDAVMAWAMHRYNESPPFPKTPL